MRKLTFVLAVLGYGFTSTLGMAKVNVYFNQNPEKSYIEPYRNFRRAGDNLEKVLVDQINSAQQSIYIAVQELRLPKVALALAYQKSMGRDVRIILENNYNNTVKNFKPIAKSTPDNDDDHDSNRHQDFFKFVDMNNNGRITWKEMGMRDAVYILHKAGIKIIDDTHDGSLGSSLMHHKFMIIDRERVVISSANFTLSGIHGDFSKPKSLGNDNSMMVIDSVELSNFFTKEFLIMWGGAKGRSAARFGVNKPYRGIQTTYLNDNTEVRVMFSPTSLRRFWQDSTNGLIAREIEGAQKSIDSALFVFSDQRIANAMESIHNKGVLVDIVAESKFAFREYSEVLDMFGLAMFNRKCEFEPDNRPWLRPMKNVGIVSNRHREGDLLHHKYAVIDDKKVVFGSHNWSNSANHQNDEFLMVIENPIVAKAFKSEFKRIKSTASIGAPAWLSRRITDVDTECRKVRSN